MKSRIYIFIIWYKHLDYDYGKQKVLSCDLVVYFDATLLLVKLIEFYIMHTSIFRIITYILVFYEIIFITLSITEVEYIIVGNNIAQVLWLRK